VKNKQKLEFYNYLLKVSSLLRINSLFPEENSNKEIEELTMEILNNFENVNFNRPNYFYKEKHITPSNHFVLIVESDQKYLFIKNENNIEIPNGYFELFTSFKDNLIEYFKRIGSELINFELKGIKFIDTFREKNENIDNLTPVPEYLYIVKAEVKGVDNMCFLEKNEIKDTKLYTKEEILNFIEISNKEKIEID